MTSTSAAGSYLVKAGGNSYMLYVMDSSNVGDPSHKQDGLCAVIEPYTEPIKMYGTFGVEDSYIGGSKPAIKGVHFDYDSEAEMQKHLQFLRQFENSSKINTQDDFVIAAKESYTAARAAVLTARESDILKDLNLPQGLSLPQLLEAVDPLSEEGKALSEIREKLDDLLGRT